MVVYDSKNKIIIISELIKKGGEGSIYRIKGMDNLLAKIYHEPINIEKQNKLIYMSQSKNDKLLEIAAWPMDVLYNSIGKDVIGFLMHRVTDAKLIHYLYTPKSRLAEFPQAGWDFLIHTAANLARLFDRIHEYDYVIGDVNHSNFLVSNQGIVKIIDCDSFQVKKEGITYPCEVGEPTFQPPEIQGLSTYSNIIRTKNHDNFGLAVMIFHLIFMGRHPYAGKYLGSGDMTVELAIKEFRFAYGSNANFMLMEQPPFTLKLSQVTSKVGKLFERSFGVEGTESNKRPTPLEWVKALQDMQSVIKLCSNNLNHSYLNTLNMCPFCQIEKSIKANLFKNAVRSKYNNRQVFNIEIMINKIMNIPSPENIIKLPGIQNNNRVSPRLTRARRTETANRILPYMFGLVSAIFCLIKQIPLVISICLFIVAIFVGRIISKSNLKYKKVRNEVIRNYFDAKRSFEDITEEWNREPNMKNFQCKKDELLEKGESYKSLMKERQFKIEELERNQKDLQLKKYLDKFRIDDERIHGVGTGKKALLRSFGVETALDITANHLGAIPRLGKSCTARLFEWREKIELLFAFNPTIGIDAADIDAIDISIDDEKIKLEKFLSDGIVELKDISNKIIQKRRLLLPEVERCAEILSKALSDYNAIK
jgi:DNA-binding helix-hairpin-helix protein with protein kinase domain